MNTNLAFEIGLFHAANTFAFWFNYAVYRPSHCALLP